MGWKGVTVMDQRIRFLSDYLEGLYPFTELCQHFGLSRKTGYKRVGRYRDYGAEGLEERSRRPLTCPHQTDDDIIQEIVKTREKHPTWGPKKLLHVIGERHPEWTLPAISTTADILKRKGLIDLVITVGEVSSPTDLNATIDTEVQTLELLPEIVNSYSANLQSANDMIDKGNITAVSNQYEVVIHKIEQDLKQNKIDQADADILTMMISDAIALLDK